MTMAARKITVTASDRRARAELQERNARSLQRMYSQHATRMQEVHNSVFRELESIVDPVERWAAVRATTDMLNQMHHDLFAVRSDIVRELRHDHKMAISPTRVVAAEEQGITDVLGIKRARVMQLLAGRGTSKRASAKKTSAKKTN